MFVLAVLAAVAGAQQAGPTRAPALVPFDAARGVAQDRLRQAQDEDAASPARAAAGADTEVSGVVVTAPAPKPEPAWARKLNLDPRGDYARSDIPYLRRPVDGCKLMAGGSASPAGVEGVAAGPVCVKRFTSPFR